MKSIYQKVTEKPIKENIQNTFLLKKIFKTNKKEIKIIKQNVQRKKSKKKRLE